MHEKKEARLVASHDILRIEYTVSAQGMVIELARDGASKRKTKKTARRAQRARRKDDDPTPNRCMLPRQSQQYILD